MNINKKVTDLKLEEKRNILAARDLAWVVNDIERGEYMFVLSMITGENYLPYNPEHYHELIKAEFDEAFIGKCDNFTEDTTVKDLVEDVSQHSEFILERLADNRLFPDE